MVIVEEFILLPLVQRQAHLRLYEPCTERGGKRDFNSVYCKGLLAFILDTTIPFKVKIFACHACSNGMCSNPYHLYWGTPTENVIDAILSGANKGVWQHTVDKYGLAEAKRRNQKNSNPSLAGHGNKGKQKSAQHRQKISEGIAKFHAGMANRNSGPP
jgi:hypothetical protein